MKILEIDDYGSVDFKIPLQSLNYLIFLTEELGKLIELSLNNGIEKITLKGFFDEYNKSEHKEGYLIGFGYDFYYTFINQSDSFIFDPYFFDNTATSDIEKIAKINRLAENINSLLNEIRFETKSDSLVKPAWNEKDEIIHRFEQKFPNYLIINGIKTRQYSYKLLQYFFGVYLNKMFNKIITNYVGFIKESSIGKFKSQIKSNNKTAQNPFPDIFKSHEVYKNFISYTSKHIIDPYRDYSYLFQRLKKDELIHDMKHKKFINWLYTESLIREKDYNIFLDNAGFRSYSKSYSEERVNNFNNIFI